jgi:hypothetical protein
MKIWSKTNFGLYKDKTQEYNRLKQEIESLKQKVKNMNKDLLWR